MTRYTTALVFGIAGIALTILSGCGDKASPIKKVANTLPASDSGYVKISDNLFALPLKKTDAGGAGSKRFSMLKNSGVDFKNYMERDITNMLLETGSGVALGDYDNDGLIDIYLTGSDVDNKLFRNLGNMKFDDTTFSAKVDGRIKDNKIWASGASFSDIDNDGDLDLYVCNMAAPDLLYINRGDGTFKEEGFTRGVAYNGASKQANFCDYDHDGDMDFYLVTYQDIVEIPHQLIRENEDGEIEVVPGKEEYVTIIDGHVDYWPGEQDLLYRNDGSGNFEEVARDSGIAGYDCGLASVWFDYDNDGWQDIYVTSDFKQPDHLYRNNHDGTFTDVLPETVRRTPWYSMGVDAGDLNNDGQLDFLVADMADQTHYGQKINMGDMSDSGWFLTYGKPRQFMVNCLFVNAGDKEYFELARQTGLAKTDWTWSVRFADLDLDGNQDVFITNGHARDNMNSDIVNRLNELKAKKGGEPLTFEERDKFGIQIPVREETNLAYANRGNLEFEAVGEDWGLDYHGVSHSAGFADLDLDGDLDCVINNYYTPSLVYENKTADGGRLLVELRSGLNNFYGVGSKIEIWQADNYQRRDLTPGRGYLTSDPMMVHFGVDESQKIDRLKVTWPGSRVQEFTDLDPNFLYRVIDSPDNKPESPPVAADTMFADGTEAAGLDFVYKESEFDDFEREPLLPFQLSRLGASVSCGDVDGDGVTDIFCGSAAGQPAALFMNRNGKFEKVAGPWESKAVCEDMACLFFDADGDGDTDLYVTSGSNEFDLESENYRDSLYRNNGDGSFEDVTESSLPDLRDSSMSVAAGDFDRDGDLDLFVGSRSVPGQYPVMPESHLLINEGGKFSVSSPEIGDFTNVGLVNSAIWSDFNDDGWLDLIVAREWGPVSIYQNNEGTFSNETENLGLGGQSGWWHGIVAADLDADGDMDYVVTNQGLNTKYHATAEHPHRLYFEDFDNNGTLDLVESEYEGDIEYPVRGRSCSSRCMPFIAEKFPKFHDFSLATLDDIYETDSQARQHVELNYLESVILWNDGGNGFESEALPSIGQISPSFGVVVKDFDGDGILDIVLANNFFGSQPETGFMDGGLGLMLKGTGTRDFDPQWPRDSGIVVTGDANGLVTADWDSDGDEDLLVAVNGDQFKVFTNQSDFDATKLSIEGPSGNAEGIGSTIKLHFKEGGQVQSHEISAGGGYLSQSANSIRVPSKQLERIEKISVRWPDGTSTEKLINSEGPESTEIKFSYQSQSDDK
ncbi:FG-GAP-like repeat-containing protein [Mariniblastus fucicola]|uniref:FG-GAP repeat protein n=1 Tax=Mariniblastus fucicola TaxID=980251 RepID=A0A5B9PAF9_9BACT|nr:FG-GAP-like repeat-containing protein [Mariniblastus fucicola]QEG23254.1 FG-GAP repeat protein [Mariniblastus fucicola]